MDPLRFEVTLDNAAGGGIKIPYDVRALFGKARAPVVVTVLAGQEHTYRSTVAVYGGAYFVPLNKVNATAAAIAADEPFSVTVAFDDQPRVVTVPADLAAAIDEAEVRERWDRLSHTHQREHVEAVEGARKPETRRRRIQGAVDRLNGS
jgi:putative heme degradation protein